jgi:hypothetical protein
VATHRRAARPVRGTPTLAGITERGGASDRRRPADAARSIAGAPIPVRLVSDQPAGQADGGRSGALGQPPPVDRLVVCHGDACSPNTLIDDDGRCCGHVDFGDLGAADRWADLAVATLSLGWNYPGGVWDAEFFSAYGIEPDPTRMGYYRRLWQAEDDTSR